jgi:hypothetical protein
MLCMQVIKALNDKLVKDDRCIHALLFQPVHALMYDYKSMSCH